MNRVFLVGNPNSGKTTVFNGLTGDQQRIGNWPGVTVERKTGIWVDENRTTEITDLPGIYSLSMSSGCLDEQVTIEAMASGEADIYVNIIDACHLERHLYLTTQLLEYGKPVIVGLNMMDLARQQGIRIDIQALSEQLACPVVSLEAHRLYGMDALKNEIQQPQKPAASLAFNFSPELEAALDKMAELPCYQARRLLENDPTWDIYMADARYQTIHTIVQKAQKKMEQKQAQWTARIDRWVLHRWLGLPIFLAVMYGMFYFAIHLGGCLQTSVDQITQTVLVTQSAHGLSQINCPGWLVNVLSEGLGKGMNVTLSLLPVMACMYFFLSFLEISGYMVRVAFVLDRLMHKVGLPGKAFVPMIIGFGCNVPAVMAARTLDIWQERLLTILMIPFMSCSARLAIYTVFVAVFFPGNGYNIVFSLYIIGVALAVFTGFLFRKTLFQGAASPLILELPLYHRPLIMRLYRETSRKLWLFMTRAGGVIIPLCVILGGLPQSKLIAVGQFFTPIFSPMGITTDQWPAVMALMTGVIAKEVVLGTLSGLLVHTGQGFEALFSGKGSAYAYLLFVLLYMPCVSTMAAICQESKRRWMWLSIAWSFLVAYAMATLFYQMSTLFQHPRQSIAWVMFWSTLLCVGYYALRRLGRGYYVVANS